MYRGIGKKQQFMSVAVIWDDFEEDEIMNKFMDAIMWSSD